MEAQDNPDELDRAALARCRAGDPDGLAALYRAWAPKVYGLALRTLRRRDAAEDVVQDTFLQVHRGAAGFRGESRVGSWIYAIALNACRMRLRGERRAPLPLERAEDLAAPETPDPSGALDRALATLDAPTRELLLLSAHGHSYDDIAGLLGLGADQVRGRLYRARRVLLERLQESGS